MSTNDSNIYDRIDERSRRLTDQAKANREKACELAEHTAHAYGGIWTVYQTPQGTFEVRGVTGKQEATLCGWQALRTYDATVPLSCDIAVIDHQGERAA